VGPIVFASLGLSGVVLAAADTFGPYRIPLRLLTYLLLGANYYLVYRWPGGGTRLNKTMFWIAIVVSLGLILYSTGLALMARWR